MQSNMLFDEFYIGFDQLMCKIGEPVDVKPPVEGAGGDIWGAVQEWLRSLSEFWRRLSPDVRRGIAGGLIGAAGGGLLTPLFGRPALPGAILGGAVGVGGGVLGPRMLEWMRGTPDAKTPEKARKEVTLEEDLERHGIIPHEGEIFSFEGPAPGEIRGAIYDATTDEYILARQIRTKDGRILRGERRVPSAQYRGLAHFFRQEKDPLGDLPKAPVKFPTGLPVEQLERHLEEFEGPVLRA